MLLGRVDRPGRRYLGWPVSAILLDGRTARVVALGRRNSARLCAVGGVMAARPGRHHHARCIVDDIHLRHGRRGIRRFGVPGPRRCWRCRRCRRLHPLRCGRRIDRLKLRQAFRLSRSGRGIGRRQAIALEPAIDRRVRDLRRRASAQRLVDRPGFRLDRARVEVDQLITGRLRHRRPDRTAIAERCGFDGAERRRDHALAPALGHARLPREQRGEILISDRCRHQRGTERAEPEARRAKAARPPATRPNHHPSRPLVRATRARLSKRCLVARMRHFPILSD